VSQEHLLYSRPTTSTTTDTSTQCCSSTQISLWAACWLTQHREVEALLRLSNLQKSMATGQYDSTHTYGQKERR
jgi:hypothetical protein